MTQSDHSTVSRAVFTSAWIEFCRTSEGRHEYWRRFGDYLFTEPNTRDPPRASIASPTHASPKELPSAATGAHRVRRKRSRPQPRCGSMLSRSSHSQTAA